MYIITIKNGGVSTEIHNYKRKLLSGKIVKGINTIDSFTFTMLPTDAAFNEINDYTTFVKAYNTFTKRYDFKGRVLCSELQMNEQGLLTRSVTCESLNGYLCDSEQDYVAEKEWTFQTYFKKIADVHNSQVEGYKKITLGTIASSMDGKTKFTCEIPRKKTWEAINENIIKVFGGEITVIELVDGIALNYVKEQGSKKSTEILVGKNMRSVIRERDSTEFVTRLIPLGAKKSNDGEERYDITSATPDGVNYIEDTEALAEYGIHVRSVEFDTETTAEGLLIAGKEWLEKNNKVRTKYTVNALDLSLLGLSVDDFDVGNTHPIKNRLLGIDDSARIIKKTIDINDETKSSIELGEKFEALSEMQRKDAVTLQNVYNTLVKIEANYVTNTEMVNEINVAKSSIIEQTSDSIMLKVEEKYVEKGDNNKIASMISLSTNQIEIATNRIKITAKNFTLDFDGTVTARKAVFDDCEIKSTCKVYGTVLADTVCSNEYTIGDGTVYRGSLLFGKWDSSYYYKDHSGYALRVEGTEEGEIFEGGLYVSADNGDVTILSCKKEFDGTYTFNNASSLRVNRGYIEKLSPKIYISTDDLLVSKYHGDSFLYKGLTGWVESWKRDGVGVYTYTEYFLHFVNGILVEVTAAYDENTMTEWLI